MSQYTGASIDPVREFLDWRYNAGDLYDSLTMYVLPEHTISLNFTNETVLAEDSYVFGIVLGNSIKDKNSEIALYNTIFPNRNSLCFNKSKPNQKWGEVSHSYSFKIDGTLNAVDTNTKNDIVAAYDNKLIYISEKQDFIHQLDDEDDQITLIQCTPDDLSTSSFLCKSKNNTVLYFESPDKKPLAITEFTRPIIDLSIDSFNTNTALCTQGKPHIHLVDKRTKSTTSLKMQSHTGSVAFSPSIPFVFANGLLTGDIGLFDIRSPSAPICNIQAHDSAVTSLRWSPLRKDLIASSSLDASIIIWSLTENKDINSNAVFTHNGHVSPVSTFNWCKDVPWTLASVSEDNLFEIWTISQSQYEDFMFE